MFLLLYMWRQTMAKQPTTRHKSGFEQFCEKCFLLLNADQRVEIENQLVGAEMSRILDDKELFESLKSFFANNLNISETSRNTFVHRNTLVYRLDKIQKITGLDARNFEDAISIRLYMWLKNRD